MENKKKQGGYFPLCELKQVYEQKFPSAKVVVSPINRGQFYIAQANGRDFQANNRADAIAKALTS